MDKIIEVIDICKSYLPEKSVLSGVTFEVNQGDVVAIMGKNGCGKSTLLRIIAGLDKKYSGIVKYRGNIHSNPTTNIILMQQTYEQLFPWMTVEENVAKPIQLTQKIKAEEAKKISRQFLKKVSLEEELYYKYPYQLSGGQKQKAALARALALEAEVLLMDEPFSAIDETSKVAFQELLRDLSSQHGKTIVLVSHSKDEAERIADKIVRI